MQGEGYIGKILEYGTSEHPDSPFLTEVGRLRHDKHDVAGMIRLAQEGLSAIGADDPFRPALQRIYEYARSDKRYDEHDAKGILFLCKEAVDQQAEPSFGA